MQLDASPTCPLEAAIELVGGQSALARKLGPKVRQGHVWSWLRRTRRVPSEYCIPVEQATGGAVTRYDLRPDVFGPAPAKPAADAAPDREAA